MLAPWTLLSGYITVPFVCRQTKISHSLTLKDRHIHVIFISSCTGGCHLTTSGAASDEQHSVSVPELFCVSARVMMEWLFPKLSQLFHTGILQLTKSKARKWRISSERQNGSVKLLWSINKLLPSIYMFSLACLHNGVYTPYISWMIHADKFLVLCWG